MKRCIGIIRKWGSAAIACCSTVMVRLQGFSKALNSLQVILSQMVVYLVGALVVTEEVVM